MKSYIGKIAACLLLLYCWQLQAQTLPWKPLLEPDELAQALEQDSDIRVLQVTGSFARGHVPGAVNSPYNNWRGPIENPGSLPSLEVLTGLVQSLGIEGSSPVVVMHAGTTPADMGAATRVYWSLKSLGVARVAVVNGGLQAWQAQGLPVSTEETAVVPSTWQPRWDNRWYASTADVEALVDSGKVRLMDARPQDFFAGLRSSFGRPGTIRGAANVNYETLFAGNRLLDTAQLGGLLGSSGPTSAAVHVAFCNTGHWSSINWFVMSEVLGVENVRLYAESMAEWSQSYRPMDNGPGRLAIYAKLTRDWLDSLFGNGT